MHTNFHMQRAIDLREREERAERAQTQADRRADVIWFVQILVIWLFGMAIVYFRTIYAATVQINDPSAGISMAICLGILVSLMCWGIWWRER